MKAESLFDMMKITPLPSFQPFAVSNMIEQLKAYHHSTEELCQLAEALGDAMHAQHYREKAPVDMHLFDCGQAITGAAQELREVIEEVK